MPNIEVQQAPRARMSEPSQATTAQIAQAHLQSLKKTREEQDINIRGRTPLSGNLVDAIPSFLRTDKVACRLTKADSALREIAELTINRFEELHKRLGFSDLPNPIRRAVWRVLVQDLATCADAFGKEVLKLRQLASALLYNRRFIALIMKEGEFSLFHELPGAIRVALRGYPIDPRAFLRSVRDSYQAVLANPRHKYFHDAPGCLLQIALRYPDSLPSFLTEVRRRIRDIRSDKRFEDIHDQKAILLKVAYSYTDPKKFLVTALETREKLKSDPELADFYGQRTLLLSAVISHPSNPKAFLLGVRSRMQSVLTDPRCAELAPYRGLMLRLASTHTRDTKAAALRIISKKNEILALPEFAAFRESPLMVLDVIVRRPKNPETLLRAMLRLERGLARDPELNKLGVPAWLVRVAGLGSPTKPKEFIKAVYRDYHEIMGSSKFAYFHTRPGITLHSVAMNREDPKAALRSIRANVRAMLADKSLHPINKHEGDVLFLAANYPGDPFAAASRAKEQLASVSASDEFAHFHALGPFLHEACIKYNSDPKPYLRRITSKLEQRFGASIYDGTILVTDKLIREVGREAA